MSNALSITCPACSRAVTTEGPDCPLCGANVQVARIEARTAEMSEKLRQLRARTAKPGATSVNGWGTMLLGYAPCGDGTWHTTRWVTASGLPLIPLRGLRIRPIGRGGHSYNERLVYDVLEEGKPNGRLVLHTYRWLAAGALPVAVWFFWSSMREQLFGKGPLAFFLTLPLIAWAIYALMRIHDSDKAFGPKQPKTASPPGAAVHNAERRQSL